MNILFFGDSNTHGSNPVEGGRHGRDSRFTGILQKELGENYYIIEEGLGGRTAVFEDPLAEGRCGIDYISPCLNTHKPLDLIVVMLGTNDTKPIFNANARCINIGIQRLLKCILHHGDAFRDKCNILLVSPCVIKPGASERIKTMDDDCTKKSEELIPLLENTAEEMGLYYMAASDFAEVSDEDKVHLDAAGHRKLADAFKVKILEIESLINS
ncbi:MAG: GDSL-type esterase/lipase family protein [Clostridia bacterium]